MSKLTRDDVLHVAKLANLHLTDSEIEKFTDQLSSVLNYMQELQKIDVTNVEPTSQTTGLTNVKRKDDLSDNDTLNVKEALSGTESVYNDYFLVDAILEKDKNDI